MTITKISYIMKLPTNNYIDFLIFYCDISKVS
nr:MAG TPA: hypothetical protein [Caudoviricetes sp.]